MSTLKIKLNIKSSKQEKSPVETISFKQLDSELKKVIPYEDDETLDSPIDQQPNKIIIKPKITVGSKIKINVKKNTDVSQIDEHWSDDEDEDYDDENEFSIEPKVVLKTNNTPQTIVKINVKKKTETPKLYKSLILDQKPIKKLPNEPFNLSGKIELESFYDDGQTYYIDWKSKYIFPPDLTDSNSPMESFDLTQPIGKLIDLPWEAEDFKEDKYPLIKRKIEWFYHYELDADALN